MTNYLQLISTILGKKGFSFSMETLNNLLEILSDEKKEQLMRVILSIREYTEPEMHYTDSVSDDLESRESILAMSESFLYNQNLGFSRFDFIEEFFDDLTKEQRIAFLKLFVNLQHRSNVYYRENEDSEYEEEGYEEYEDEEPEDEEYEEYGDGEYDGEYDDEDDR